MNQPGERFQHRWTGQLERLHKNLYLNRSDPMYYEKVLRYADPSSPEALYRVGQKYEAQGNREKAAEHYRKCLRRRDTEYAALAARALRRLEPAWKVNGGIEAGAVAGQGDKRHVESRFPIRTMAFLLGLLFMFAVVLLLAAIRPDTASATLSALKNWGVGKSVIHQTVEVPYVLYFPSSATEKDMEDLLFKETLGLGRASPNMTVLVYGLAAEAADPEPHALPMTNPDAADKAVAVAQYRANQDRTVSIRFLNREYRNLRPVSEVGANLVRTALAAYMEEHGAAPSDVHELAADYPANYLSFIPIEPMSRSDRVVRSYDGTGGWVYRPLARELGEMFTPNVPGFFAYAKQEQFSPLQLLVDKAHHKVQLLMGDAVILQAPVGLGANGSTPTGKFRVAERVLKPAGSRPGVYGAAALGLGEIAVHGTDDGGSIGRDASLGCVRVADAQILALYPLVPKGTVVRIVESGAALPAEPEVQDSVLAALTPAQKNGQEEQAHGKRFAWLG